MTTDVNVPSAAVAFGMRVKPTGTHLSSTMKFEELQTLLAGLPATATEGEYKAAVIDQNLLGKPTATTRRITFARLRELYGLDPSLLVFRALRDVWDADETAQPMIALLSATARDPILRAMTPFILRLPIDATVTAQELSEEAEQQFPGKFVVTSRNRLGRNASSSWEKAGLLSGKQKRTRVRSEARPISLSYALLLGDLCGRRGRVLFSTLWTSIVDTPMHSLKELAVVASRQGWIEYRASGDVVEVSFRYLMRENGVRAS